MGIAFGIFPRQAGAEKAASRSPDRPMTCSPPRSRWSKTTGDAAEGRFVRVWMDHGPLEPPFLMVWIDRDLLERAFVLVCNQNEPSRRPFVMVRNQIRTPSKALRDGL